MTDNYQLVYSQGRQYFKFTDISGNVRYIDSDDMLMSTALLSRRLKAIEDAKALTEKIKLNVDELNETYTFERPKKS